MEEALGSASGIDVDPLPPLGHSQSDSEDSQGPLQGSAVVPMGCTEEESTRHWVASLTNMTLNKVVLPAGESVYQDAKGQPMPPQRWPTEFHYVDGGLDQADTTDFVCVNRIIAEPGGNALRFPLLTSKNRTPKTPSLRRSGIWFRGIWISPFTTGETSVRAKARTKPGGKWTQSSLVPMTGTPSYRGCWITCPAKTSPPGGNPPTYGDLFRGKTRNGPLGHLGRPPEPKASGVATPQVSSVVQVPGKAKAESDDCPKIQALRARLKQKYGETFFSGKPVFPHRCVDRMARPRYD